MSSATDNRLLFMVFREEAEGPLIPNYAMSLTNSCSWSSWAFVLVVAPGSPGGSRACMCHTAQADVGPGFSYKCHSCRNTSCVNGCEKRLFI